MTTKKSIRDRRRAVLLLVPFFVAVISTGCTRLLMGPKGPPMTQQQIEAAISEIETQQSRVSSFYATGLIRLKGGFLETESNALIVGTRQPLKVKMEFTHSWGQPLLHVLVAQGRLEILSFKDRKLYVGPFTPGAMAKLFPGGLETPMVWSVLRGYPDVLPSTNIRSRDANRILVFDEKGREIQGLSFSDDLVMPERVSLIRQGVQVSFKDYRSQGDILFAQEVGVSYPEGKRTLVLTRKKTVFNKAIPEEIFSLKKPPHFEEVDFGEIR